jgi:photosystem II stability/assembly factor-like uncharacterized protein
VRLALRALFFTVVAVLATGSGAAAESSTRLVTTPDWMVFWNAHDGLLAVNRCRHAAQAPCERGAVELTTDGGRTYRIVFRMAAPVELQTVGPGAAIVSTNNGKNWRTLNGGRTWRRFTPSWPRVDPTAGAYWLNPRVGVRFHSYTAHDHGALAMLVTHDGGRTWQRQQDPCRNPEVAFGAFADLVTAKSWWVACVGEGGAGNEDKAIYRTRDAGRTWQAGAASILLAVHRRERGGVQTYGYPEGLAFASDGWGLLTESRGTLYVTRDGGAHFHAEPHVARPETDFAGGAAAFRGGAGYVLLTNFGGARLIETHDYGRTWVVVHRWRG